MLRPEESKIIINKILEMIYWLYLKDLKTGNIIKEINSFGKICKKRNPLKNDDNFNLFNYVK